MTTDLPIPTFAGQSPGRGELLVGAGLGGGGFGLPVVPPAAEEELQLASEVLMPMAAIILNIAELPAALPIDVRKSRRAMRVRLEIIWSSPDLLSKQRKSFAVNTLHDQVRQCRPN